MKFQPELEVKNHRSRADAKKAQKKAASTMAREGDSEACATLISDAQTAIDALEYDSGKAYDENLAALTQARCTRLYHMLPVHDRTVLRGLKGASLSNRLIPPRNCAFLAHT